MSNELKAYGLLFENRLYRVVVETIDRDTEKFEKMMDIAAFVVDLQTREITVNVYRPDILTITESNSFHAIIVNLPLITVAELFQRECQLYL